MKPETEKLINELADKFGTTVEHLWAALIKQASITIWIDAVQLALIAAVAWAACRAMKRWWKVEYRPYDDGGSFRAVASVVGCVAAALFCVWALFNVGEMLTCATNPEYWALKQLLPSK